MNQVFAFVCFFVCSLVALCGCSGSSLDVSFTSPHDILVHSEDRISIEDSDVWITSALLDRSGILRVYVAFSSVEDRDAIRQAAVIVSFSGGPQGWVGFSSTAAGEGIRRVNVHANRGLGAPELGPFAPPNGVKATEGRRELWIQEFMVQVEGHSRKTGVDRGVFLENKHWNSFGAVDSSVVSVESEL